MPLHLHIFEERYKIMISHSVANDGLLGIVLIHQGLEALGPLPEPYPVGTLSRIVEREILADGHMNITVLGVERFRILSLHASSLPYLTGTVETSPMELPNMLQVHRNSRPLAQSVRRYLTGLNQARIENLDFSKLTLPEDPTSLVYMAASLLQLPPEEKQPILEAESVCEMMTMVERLYRRENVLLRNLYSTEEVTASRAAWLN
jgi:Lon protease-like protein